MAITKSTSFVFEPQIAARHVQAYFKLKLVWGMLAWRQTAKEFAKPGKQQTFPYFNQIGAAELPGEDDTLAVDSLGDNQFSATAKEVGKAVGITDSARYESGATFAEWDAEAHRQLGRVHAERVDTDLKEEVNGAGNRDIIANAAVSDFSLQSAFGTDKGINDSKFQNATCNIRKIHSGLIDAFGDRWGECKAIIMHSQHYKNIASDATAGFLNADANNPLFAHIPGFVGTVPSWFGLAIIINDNVPKETNLTITDSAAATQAYNVYSAVYLKQDAFGLMVKQEAKAEYDRSILQRQDIMSATQWYAVKSFHKKIHAEDARIAKQAFVVEKEAA